MKKDFLEKNWRLLHLVYLVIFFIAGLCIYRNLDYAYRPYDDKLSLVANLAELVGLLSLLTEVWFLANETKKMREKMSSLNAYSDTIYIEGLIDNAKGEISSDNFKEALLRLQIIKDIIADVFPETALIDLEHPQRKLADSLNNLINTLHLTRAMPKIKKEEYLIMLTSLSREINIIRKNSKNAL